MEEHFKHKLKQHRVDWDKEELLGPLKAELSKDKRRFAWLWLVSLLTFLLGIYLGWNNQVDTSTHAPTITQQTKTLYEQGDKASSPITESQINRDPKSTELTTSSRNDINRSQATLKQAQPQTNPQQQTTSPIKLNTTPNAKPNTTAQIPSLTAAAYSKNETPTQQPFNNSNTSSGQAVTSQIQTRETKAASTFEASNPLATLEQITSSAIAINLIPSLSLQAFRKTTKQWQLPTLSKTDTATSQVLPMTSSPFYISISGEIGLVQRNRKFNSSNAEYVSRLEANEATERSLAALTTNLNIGYQHPSGWSLQSGLQYNEINEVFKYNETNTEALLLPSKEHRYFIVDRPDTIFVYDTVNVFRTIDRRVRHFNKHRFVTIPLEMGYQFDWRKATLRGQLGVSYTVLHNYKGRSNYLSVFGTSILSEDGGDFQFDLKDRIGLQLGLAIEYPLMKQSHYYVSAAYRRSPTLTRGIVEQVYQSFSVGAGFRLSLGGSE